MCNHVNVRKIVNHFQQKIFEQHPWILSHTAVVQTVLVLKFFIYEVEVLAQSVQFTQFMVLGNYNIVEVGVSAELYRALSWKHNPLFFNGLKLRIIFETTKNK